MVHLKADNEFSPENMVTAIKTSFLKHFPDSFISISATSGSDVIVIMKLALGKNNSEYLNGIVQNDPMHTVISVTGWDKDRKPTSKMRVENSSNYGLMLKAPAGSWKSYESLKLWRNFTCAPEKVVPTLDKYFAKLKEAVKNNLDRLPEYAKNKI